MGHSRAITIVFALCAAMLLTLAAPAGAQTPAPQPQATPEVRAPKIAPSGYGALLFQLVIVVVGVCLLAYLILRFGVKRFLVPDGTDEGALEVVARLPVEPRRSVLVVRIGSQHLIVGSSENGLTTLGELPEEDLHYFDREPPSSPFAKLLKRKLGSGKEEEGHVVELGITPGNGGVEGDDDDNVVEKQEKSATN